MSVILTICARGGSKGIKNKALVKLGNKKLIDYTLIIAQKIKFIDCIVISTDCDKIIKHCNNKGFETWFKRSKSLSTDNIGKLPVIIDAVKKTEKFFNKSFDTVIDLDITSPLRNLSDVKNAYSLFKKNNSDNLFSVMKSRHNPYFNMVEKKNNNIKLVKSYKPILRRQDTPITYDLNASIYIFKKKILFDTISLFNKSTSIYEMPYERSIDIDSKMDLKIVKSLIK